MANRCKEKYDDCVSIVVALEQPQLVLNLIESLARTTENHRVVVATNGMAGPTLGHFKETLEAYRGRLLISILTFDQNAGWPAAAQAGWRYVADGKFGDVPSVVAVWHDDMIPHQQWMEAALSFDQGRVGLIGMDEVNAAQVELEAVPEAIQDYWDIVAHTTTDLDGVLSAMPSAPYLIRTEAIQDVGGVLFDKDLGPGSWADWDLFERLMARNWTLFRDIDHPCYHYRQKAVWQVAGAEKLMQAARSAYLQRWGESGLWWNTIQNTRTPFVPGSM